MHVNHKVVRACFPLKYIINTTSMCTRHAKMCNFYYFHVCTLCTHTRTLQESVPTFCRILFAINYNEHAAGETGAGQPTSRHSTTARNTNYGGDDDDSNVTSCLQWFAFVGINDDHTHVSCAASLARIVRSSSSPCTHHNQHHTHTHETCSRTAARVPLFWLPLYKRQNY